MMNLKTSALIPLLIVSTGMAQWDETEAENIVPGQAMFHEFRPGAMPELLEDMNSITGGDCSVIGSIPALDCYMVGYSTDLTAKEANGLRALFDAYVDNNLLYWAIPNTRIDSADGQTGSLWVSDVGIDLNGYQNQYAVDLLGLPSTPSMSQGEGVLVSILDTGVDGTHPAMADFVAPYGVNLVNPLSPPDDSSNGIDDDGDSDIDELAGHGTFVAGLVRLVAPMARILPVTVLNDDGVGSAGIVAQGVVYAVDQGSHVIVLALGTQYQSMAITDAVAYATSKGVIVVAPVGNGGSPSCLYPAAEPTVLAIGGSDHLDDFGSYSNYNESIRFCAPGSSTLGGGTPIAEECVIGPRPGGNYFAAEGTSFSTAFAGGVAALIRAQHPEWPGLPSNAATVWEQVALIIDASPFSVSMEAPINSRPRADASDSVLGGPPAPTLGDLNADSWVDAGDLGLLLAAWASPLPTDGSLHLSDINIDFSVGADDLGLLLAAWDPAP